MKMFRSAAALAAILAPVVGVCESANAAPTLTSIYYVVGGEAVLTSSPTGPVFTPLERVEEGSLASPVTIGGTTPHGSYFASAGQGVLRVAAARSATTSGSSVQARAQFSDLVRFTGPTGWTGKLPVQMSLFVRGWVTQASPSTTPVVNASITVTGDPGTVDGINYSSFATNSAFVAPTPQPNCLAVPIPGEQTFCSYTASLFTMPMAVDMVLTYDVMVIPDQIYRLSFTIGTSAPVLSSLTSGPEAAALDFSHTGIVGGFTADWLSGVESLNFGRLGSRGDTFNYASAFAALDGVPDDVPEPATLALLGLGLAAIATRRRRPA